ncbi:ABC transporter permease subunit [Microbacterium sp. NRRL B-14842]|uniref:ABC transporter permease n=1 Tax=unclassified Microbacterium TaxID=2609290 RepID=UPI00228549AA|nr:MULTISPECIES: ABC transporter permease subunit [Microbacterium]MCZ0710417.1 ABC transporter permease subunit [Microbacterium paraoxydans]MDH5133499.1 ABC transporter permease subunit [Microbacterium sp. RD10]MDH5137252.1 ABC transporter permease subunit [Microbacterium sp. RD11]MDH5145594.1 ABC transporter permease subunit [Microbacterium sp. RD12]MDH5153930.1 ABC transporter permease subunit [Microbacterium sp. RD06]
MGLVPFAAYVLLFLALPTVLAIGSGFFDGDGAFTWTNVAALGDPVVLTTFANSAGLSLLTAAVGATVGALVSYALLGMNPDGVVRRSVDAAAGVLAQFGGVMLAFAFIAMIGIQGVVTVFLRDTFGIDIFAEGTWLYELPGLILPYIYFQVPLMVITFLPALAALKPQWVEANLTLGGSRASFWLRIGLPVLAPSFLASLLLLFANAFSSYATAAALASQGSQIVPLQIRTALTSETLLGRENLAGALALGMIVVVGVVMALYSVIQRRAARWQA